ncbi:hypothetical protein M0805_003461 [Coniferiporia weirii]|nr:hypothetical protein M0805_003461 [Coniferiporia weirii]
MTYCDRCNRWFPHDRALEQHERDSVNHQICYECNRDFPTWTGLKEHYVQSRHHHYCQRCDKHFNTDNGFINHSVSKHYFCVEHRRTWDTAEGLRQHYIQSGDHYYCTICSTLLNDEYDFLNHGEKYHYVCGSCVTIFASSNALINHNDCEHYYCRECDRVFQTAANLASHKASSIHKPRNVNCPGRGCRKAFISVSALILHAESGTCPSGVTRSTVDAFVARLDRQNVITNPARMITGPYGHQTPPAEPEYWATERSWNGYAYECFLCDSTFRTLWSLDAHLKSPRHRERIYRCPMAGCGQEYQVLSALSQHVERGSCGARRNTQVQSVMDRLTNGMRTITI